MRYMVLLNDLVKDIRDARGVEMGDKNPVLRAFAAKPAGESNVYDFGIELSEPAIDTSSAFSYVEGNGIEFAQSASSVVLVVNADKTCELHFDTVSARQLVEYSRDEDLLDVDSMGDMVALAAFVDSIPDRNVDPRSMSGGYDGYAHDVMRDVMRGAGRGDVGDSTDSLAGVTNWGIDYLETMSTVMRFDKVASGRLLDCLCCEGDTGSARRVLADFASGYERFEGYPSTGRMDDIDNVLSEMRKALVSQDFEACQANLDAFLDRDTHRGRVAVEHAGLKLDADLNHSEPIGRVSRFLREDAVSQTYVIDTIRSDVGRTSARPINRHSAYDLSPVTKDVVAPSDGKQMSQIELVSALGGADVVFVGGLDV